MSSNHRQPSAPLSNIEAIERVARFLHTGDARHLPPALRGEAEGILAMCVAALAKDDLPWPAGAARPDPGPGASIGEIVRALAGDERADADSGLFGGRRVMSNTRKTRRPFTAAVARGGEHAGILSVHRFGTDGRWPAGSGADVQFVAELICTGTSPGYFHCSDCDSITTGLRNRPDGPYDLIGVTHSPGCPWLARQAR